MLKTLNEGCADLEQYPASKVCQLAKKLESSKATTRHIKQTMSYPQAAQINLLRHQWTELAHKKKKGHKCKQHFKSKDGKPPSKKLFNPSQAHSSSDRCLKCGDTKHAQGFACPAKKYLCKAVKNMDTLQVYAFQSRNLTPNIVHIKSPLRRWITPVNLKWTEMTIPAAMTALYSIK